MSVYEHGTEQSDVDGEDDGTWEEVLEAARGLAIVWGLGVALIAFGFVAGANQIPLSVVGGLLILYGLVRVRARVKEIRQGYE